MATWGVALLLLAGVSGEQYMFHPAPEDPTAYHALVRAAAAQTPLSFGNWRGVDAEVAREAISMLKPNVILQRIYHNSVTGRTVSVLVVHCGDAHDMLGHYPPVCYPSSGYEEIRRVPKTWQVEDQVLNGYEYEFDSRIPGQLAPHIVDDFMLLPDGRCVGDMDTVDTFAKNRRLRPFGAGQMQVLTDPDMSAAERDAVFHEVVEAYLPLVRAIRLGALHEH
jgi:hypothetical protein